MWLTCGSAPLATVKPAATPARPAHQLPHQAGHPAKPGHATEETTMRQYLMKAIQDDARRAGERDRLYLEAQRARAARGPRAGSAAPVRRLALLLFRRTTA
jgi:hypothetical protein